MREQHMNHKMSDTLSNWLMYGQMNILVRVAYPNSIQDKRDWGRGVGTWKMTHVKLVKRVKFLSQ